MAFSYDIVETPPADEPCVEYDIRRAKKFLQTHSTESGDSLYDHLSELLQKILAERPKNAADVFEEYSRKVKEERFKTRSDYLRDMYVAPLQYEEAKKFMQLVQDTKAANSNEEEEATGGDEENDINIPDILELLFYFERAGVGIPRAEAVMLNLAMRKLVKTNPLKAVGFWGKILGTPKNYYVMEAELREEELNRRHEQQEMEERARGEMEETGKTEDVNEDSKEATDLKGEAEGEFNGEADNTEDATKENLTKVAENEEKDDFNIPPLPEETSVPGTAVPPEKVGTGLNKKVYFVSNTPGLDEWTELPLVTPQQITSARQIIRYFTGDLDSPMRPFPPFPGTEKNYLRTQIARISAATHVSPIGYYIFSGGIDEEEIYGEVEESNDLLENMNYDPLPVKDLADPSMSKWCHHSPYILNQGRAVWWSPQEIEENVDEESVEEEEEEEVEEENHGTGDIKEEKETGPPLLTPLSEDAVMDSIIPWTARQSSSVGPHNAIAFIRSNIWPGAFAFAFGRRFGNVYIGWGNKHYAYNYTPPPMPPVEDQYKIGPELMEMLAEEEAYRIASSPSGQIPSMVGEEDMEEDEDEDHDDDVDDADDDDNDGGDNDK